MAGVCGEMFLILPVGPNSACGVAPQDILGLLTRAPYIAPQLLPRSTP